MSEAAYVLDGPDAVGEVDAQEAATSGLSDRDREILAFERQW